MDRRTFLFVIVTSVTLISVNLFFQWFNQGDMEKRIAQQRAILTEQKQQLESEIAQKTASPKDLPLVELFTDNEAKDLIGLGVKVNGSVVTLSWAPQLPKEVYVRAHETKEQLEKVTIAYDPQSLGYIAAYLTSGTTQIPVGQIPSFGEYPVQLLNPSTDRVVFGEIFDGSLNIPQEKLDKLNKQLNGKSPSPQPLGNVLVLYKTDKGYLPAGSYDQKNKSFIQIENIIGLANLILAPSEKREVKTGARLSEQFYVLENEYQQLVFSNYGGALAEINLPFRTKENKNSVVREIGFDRDMVEHHPYNAMFPAHAYFTPGQGSFEEHAKGQLGGYYPLIRRDLIETGNRKSVKIAPAYYAFNIVSKYPEVAQLVYEVKSFEKDKIVFVASQPHRRITKSYSIAQQKEGAPYIIDLTITIEGDGKGLWLSTGVPEVELISGQPAPTLMYRIVRAKNKSEIKEVKLPKEILTNTQDYPDWIATANGFFSVLLDSTSKTDPGYRFQFVAGDEVPSRLVEIDQEYERFKAQNMPGYLAMLPLKVNQGALNYRIYAGPNSERILKQVDKKFTDKVTGYSPDYNQLQVYHGWFPFISEPFTAFLSIILKTCYQFTGSWVFSIFLLTLLLRIMLYPLNAWSMRSMIRMQEIAPKIEALKEKYKNDPRKVQMETMNLWRDTGANPLSGCFPMIIQVPFLMGMFGLLKTTFSLRGAVFVPGWIDDLSAPDVLFSWEKPIWFIGTEFHLLPIILGVVMFCQARFMASGPKDPSKMTDQQRQGRVMANMSAVFFTFIFYNFPSGLNIYWLFSMLLGMLQQWWMAKQMKAKKASDEIEVKVTPVAKKRKK